MKSIVIALSSINGGVLANSVFKVIWKVAIFIVKAILVVAFLETLQ